MLHGFFPCRNLEEPELHGPVYKFLLEAPLRAIFTQVRVEFYPLVSGWFNFVAVSKANPTLKPLKNDKKEQSDE